MQGFFNQYPNNMFPGMNMNNQEQANNFNTTTEYNTNNYEKEDYDQKVCSCNNLNLEQGNNSGCKKAQCPTTYKCCPPIVTCSKQVINQYHVTKQPYVHNYHTEVVHHYVTQNEFIPNYTCSEVHVNEPDNSNFPR